MFHAGLTARDRLEEVLGTEALATLREVSLLARDLAPQLPPIKRGDEVVVLVHGFFASAGVFRPMRARLEQELGARVASFSHTPGARVDTIARNLQRLMDRIPTGARIHLVGHSLGGVVSRYYVQELGGHRRVAQTISLASPFGGAQVATALRFFMVGADLHRESSVLRRLRASSQSHDVPHTSIVAGDDRLISGLTRAVFPGHDAVILHGRGHNSLLYDEEVIRVVIDRIRQAQRHAPYGSVKQ